VNSENKFNVAIYLRLSRDDDDYKDESQSISNQRDYITNYIRQYDEFIIVDEYIDDGYSGSNFERPAFKRLINDIEHKKINCVIVKDQSRLGRNDLVPYYIKNYFPINRVRFMALLSNVDTYNENASGNKLIGLNSFMDTKYNEDTSDKVKAIIYTKKREGKHLGATAIYGYKKNPKDKYKIIIDEKAAIVVRRIFEMFVNGNSIQMICKTLDKEQIPIPSVYKNLNRGQKSVAYGHWNTKTIWDMLKNEMYIGNMCQCVNKRPAVSVKKIIKNPKDKWIIVPNTHEPIIDKETFELAQKMFGKNSHITKRTKEFLLKGFLYCRECGHAIGINTSHNGKGYCVCNFYRRFSKENYCTPHSMPYSELEPLILREIKKVVRKANKELITSTLKKSDRTLVKIKQLEKEKEHLENVISMAQKKDDDAYMDKLDGNITFETYSNIRNRILAEKEEAQIKLKAHNELIDNLKGKSINKDYEKIVSDYLALKKPNRKVLSALIDKIIIDEDKNIEIKYKIRTPFLT